MSRNRRDFLKTSAVLGGALGAGLLAASSLASSAIPMTPKPLRILILGGTGFIGPHQVRYALARGHRVTLFNRGQINAGMFTDGPNLKQLLGDRAPNPGNYESLKGREWDVVIDNPARRPRWVREAAAAVKGHAKQYVFISTISVYASNDTPGADETAAVLTTDTPDVEDGETFARLYGPLKALCEQEAERAFPGHATIIRPGLVVGAGDPTDRFSYWPVRIERGGEVLAPPGDDPVQFIDARDLGEWTVRCVEDETYGVFNAIGPAKKFTVRQMLEGIRDTIKSNATFTYVTSAFLRAQQPPVRGWSDLPVWIAPEGSYAGFTQRSIAKALSKGLTFRPYADTVRETIAFYKAQMPERQEALRAGLKPEREKEVLAAWHAKRRASD
jgi:2'-hydroxyisoflavone reductase